MNTEKRKKSNSSAFFIKRYVQTFKINNNKHKLYDIN